MYIDKEGAIVHDGEQYTAPDGTRYPGNYPKGEIAGLTKVREVAKPADPAVVVTGSTVENAGGGYIQVWQTRPKTIDELVEDVRSKRRGEYPPIPDQIDALWKQFNQDRLNGKDLIQEADTLLNRILAVKEKYPKPVSEEEPRGEDDVSADPKSGR